MGRDGPSRVPNVMSGLSVSSVGLEDSLTYDEKRCYCLTGLGVMNTKQVIKDEHHI